MSPTQVYDHHSTKQIIATNNPSTLKIKKDSHSIRKSPSSSSSSSSSSSLVSGASFMATRTPPRHPPVIIYTHSPKVIHTNPQDFMALVQKLTGLPRPENDHVSHCSKPDKGGMGKNIKVDRDTNPNRIPACGIIEDNEATSMITDDNRCNIFDAHVNSSSCYVPFYDPPNASFNNMSLCHKSGSNEFLASSTPFYNNYSDPLLVMPNMRSSFSSPTFGSINELLEL